MEELRALHAAHKTTSSTPHLVQVKLKCAGEDVALPTWLEQLLASVYADKVKISKYNYGCAMLLPHLCRAFPNWIGHVQNPFEGV
jgi:SPX domain protein involved in polyphosphate accumulation